MTVKIVGGNPTVSLGVGNYTLDLDHPNLVAWHTFDDSSMEVSGDRVIGVRGRKGPTIAKMADSLGPQRQARSGQIVAKFNNGEFNYLARPEMGLNCNSFSFAAIIYTDSYIVQARDLLGLFESGNGVSVRKGNGFYSIRNGGNVYLETTLRRDQTGWILVAGSVMGGTARLSTQLVHQAPAQQSSDGHSPPSFPNCGWVVGADEFQGPIGGAPATARAWGDAIAETFLWSEFDLLAPANEAYWNQVRGYFNSVFGG